MIRDAYIKIRSERDSQVALIATQRLVKSCSFVQCVLTRPLQIFACPES